MLEKLEYYICLFLYGLKEKEQVSKNTLFRYVYIFDVVMIIWETLKKLMMKSYWIKIWAWVMLCN